MRIFQLRRRPHRQRPAHRAHVGFQRLAQLVGKRRTDELRENLLVGHLGGEHVFQPVVADEGVEIVGRHHHRAGNRHADVLVLGVLAVFHQHAVHEGQSARLATERPLADTRESDGVGISRGIEFGHHALPQQRAVVADESYQHAAVFFDRREVALVILADRRRQREQSPRVEPFREVILRGVVFERPVGDRGDHLLHLRQVLRAADLGARVWVLENEVAEGELFGDVVVQLREQRLGVLGDESRTQLRGLFAESHL